MPKVPQPFRGERYEIGTARDGRAVALEPMTPVTADQLGAAIARVGPWAHYAIPPATLAENSSCRASPWPATDRVRWRTAGAVAVRPMWLMGPYLQMLAVLPPFQGQGIGTSVVAWFEAEARIKARNAWLCVSAFNPGAQRLYLAHGFEPIATLDSWCARATTSC